MHVEDRDPQFRRRPRGSSYGVWDVMVFQIEEHAGAKLLDQVNDFGTKTRVRFLADLEQANVRAQLVYQILDVFKRVQAIERQVVRINRKASVAADVESSDTLVVDFSPVEAAIENLGQAGIELDAAVEEVLADLRRRDAEDRQRDYRIGDVSQEMTAAADVVEFDTTGLDLGAVIERLAAWSRERGA